MHPELVDVSHDKLLTIKNYYELMIGFATPVQLEGMPLLLMPFPQEESIKPRTARAKP
jgi:hypothetical protein